MYDGKGTLNFPWNATYVGEFKAGKLEGIGEVTMPDGEIIRARFKDDEMIEKF